MEATDRQLYLVRHAHAGTRGPRWPDDDVRPLTRRGIQSFAAVVAALRHLDVRIDVVLTSPLVRAHQTADLLAAGLVGTPEVEVCAALAPGVTSRETLKSIGRATASRRVALVGHEPGLGQLAAALIGGRRAVPFKKGGACRIDIADWTHPRGTLVWFLPPRLLRALGGT